MISRIDHVSIAVRDYERASTFFMQVLGAVKGSWADDPGMQYLWQIFSLGDLSRIELLTPTGEQSFLNNFLREREGGVHHINLQTPDILKARERLDAYGIPYFGFNDYGEVWKELFIHPRDAFGVLIQIAEFTADDWISPMLRMSKTPPWGVEKCGTDFILRLVHPGGGSAAVRLTREQLLQLSKDLESAAGA